MRVTPILYLTHEKDGLETVKMEYSSNQLLSTGLKVIRQRGNSYFEQFEFAQYPEKDTFTIQGIHDTGFPLWNVMQYFVEHLEDLLFGVTINEYNPHFVMSRFEETTGNKSYMISYNKQRYPSIDAAK